MDPKMECEELLSALLPFAEQQLKKRGGFYPFGAVMSVDGEIKLTAYDDGTEHPDANEAIAYLKQGDKESAERNEIKASGIVWDGRVTSPNGKTTDAIVISLEHRDDYSVTVVEPYKIGLFKKLITEELYATEGSKDIF